MLFNSFHFLIFFILVTGLFFALPHRWRWLWLLVSSCYFYMAFIPVYILILGGTIVVDYLAALAIEKVRNTEGGQKRSRQFLIASLIANVGVLAVFKYFNFFNENLSNLLRGMAVENPIPFLTIALPIGLSFHTFQAMSYTIEVYRGHQKAERHFGIYALYVMFYPQLVAGPIERPQNILHQFYSKQTFDAYRVADGLKLMLWGLFKKVVIADRLAIVTDPVFNQPDNHPASLQLIAMVFFSFQIFCDFSGYSDMAIGSAKVMGFDLMTNFKRPYQARSIQDFWSRWHISLSTWFRDYLYIPLGGNRVSVPRWYLNTFIVFMVSGLWHGANWTFIVWGALHGFFIVFANWSKNTRQRFNTRLGLTKSPRFMAVGQVLITFGLVTFAWTFFRADSFPKAFYLLSHAWNGLIEMPSFFAAQGLRLGIPSFTAFEFVVAIGSICFMEIVHYYQSKMPLRRSLNLKPMALRWFVYYIAVLAIIFLGVFENRQFIYFQF